VGQFAENRKAKTPMKKNMAHDAVPCTRLTFERLLQYAGFPLKDGLACGLVLKVDLEAVLLSQAALAGGSAPARTIVRKETRQ
jgi:hypothetical protein